MLKQLLKLYRKIGNYFRFGISFDCHLDWKKKLANKCMAGCHAASTYGAQTATILLKKLNCMVHCHILLEVQVPDLFLFFWALSVTRIFSSFNYIPILGGYIPILGGYIPILGGYMFYPDIPWYKGIHNRNRWKWLPDQDWESENRHLLTKTRLFQSLELIHTYVTQCKFWQNECSNWNFLAKLVLK